VRHLPRVSAGVEILDSSRVRFACTKQSVAPLI
jgi:hypothetical protein